MTFGFDSAILLISSYANPVETLQHARQQGYQVTDFMISPMPFGYYSSEPKVCRCPQFYLCLHEQSCVSISTHQNTVLTGVFALLSKQGTCQGPLHPKAQIALRSIGCTYMPSMQ